MKKKTIGVISSAMASGLTANPVYNPASSAQFNSRLFTGAQSDYTVRCSKATYKHNHYSVSIADQNSIYNLNQVTTSVTLNDMKARAKLHLGIGSSLYTGKMFGLNIEGLFIDEQAASITAEIRI